MSKQLIFDEAARQAILTGVQQLSSAVKVTLGPKGKNVVIEQEFGSPTMTKDGVSVAKSISLPDTFENMGAQMVKQVASRTSDTAGDGTTTATILAEAIYKKGMKAVVSGYNPMSIKRGIDKACVAIVKKLKELSNDVDSIDEIKQIGVISANGDTEIGDILAQAMEKVGTTGTITLGESRGIETVVEFVEGMQFSRGYLSPYFATDPETLTTNFEDVYLLMLEQKLTNVQDMLPIIQKVAKTKKPLLIIADDVDGEALATLVLNRMRGGLQVCAIKSPEFGDIRKEAMEDISVLTGGKFITEELGLKMENLELTDLGKAKTITVTKTETTIVDGAGTEEDLTNRVKVIQGQMKNAPSQFIGEKLASRLARLTSGVAIIKIGAATELELKERKDRLEDALHATKAASEEGIIQGGGTALLEASHDLTIETVDQDEQMGIQAVIDSCAEPLRQLAINAGMDPGMTVAKTIELPTGIGFNIATGKEVDLIVSGIIDPTKVTRSALENASSIAGMLITTECMIADDDKTKEVKDTIQPQMGGMPGMM